MASRLCEIQRRSSVSYNNADESEFKISSRRFTSGTPRSASSNTSCDINPISTIQANKSRVQTLQPFTTDDLTNAVVPSEQPQGDL